MSIARMISPILVYLTPPQKKIEDNMYYVLLL